MTDEPIFPSLLDLADTALFLLRIWIAILFMPGALLPFFQGGPFSWNGIIGFWLVAVAFFGWILMMWWMTVRAVRNDPSLE